MSTPLPPLVVEPSAVEIAAAVDGAWRERKDGYEAIVFAGLGEPTLRLDVLIEAAQKLREVASFSLSCVILQLLLDCERLRMRSHQTGRELRWGRSAHRRAYL